jgi:uncharacterized protein YuzE
MRATYDPAADAAYVYLCDIPPGVAVEQRIVDREGPGTIVLDFDRQGVLLGIELLGATSLAPPELLADAERG